MAEPFILLDDARAQGAANARLYRVPMEIVSAHRPGEVEGALARVGALQSQGLHLAGYLAYEAGLCLEPRLLPLAEARTGAAGPLVWFGAFADYETIVPAEVPARLSAMAERGEAGIGPLEPARSPGDYAASFARMHEAIHAGDIYQVNLTFPLEGAWRGDPVELYARLRSCAKAGYGGIVFDGAHWLLSFSPELFFSLKGRSAMVKPMKGTRPRGGDAASDEALRADLAGSTKDKAENLMIVDLMRNDLSRVAVPGTVAVERPFTVETYPTVHQMVTTVRADLREGLDAMDMLRALFPCGSITGAPKVRAMELIDAIEPQARGPYCGAIGRIDASGDAAFNVAIRTLRLGRQEAGKGRAVLGVGSAIVADSRGMDEWRECLVKGGFVRQSTPDARAADFDLIETMRFAPDEGIALLELHLERMKDSASELGFGFDRHAARNMVQAVCFDLDAAAKVRLLLARSGAITLEAAALDHAPGEPVRCGALSLPVDPGDWRLRHKCTDRGFYEAAYDAAAAHGAGEAVLVHPDGRVTEASRANIFVERDGMLLTPRAETGLLPGVLRRSLIESGKAREADLTLDDLADGFLLGNAVRGLMRAELL